MGMMIGWGGIEVGISGKIEVFYISAGMCIAHLYALTKRAVKMCARFFLNTSSTKTKNQIVRGGRKK